LRQYRIKQEKPDLIGPVFLVLLPLFPGASTRQYSPLARLRQIKRQKKKIRQNTKNFAYFYFFNESCVS